MIILHDKKFQKYNLNWPQIPNNIYRILIIGGSGCEKAKLFLNLTSCHTDTDQMYLHANDLYEAKYQILIKKYKGVCLMILKFLLHTRMIWMKL